MTTGIDRVRCVLDQYEQIDDVVLVERSGRVYELINAATTELTYTRTVCFCRSNWFVRSHFGAWLSSFLLRVWVRSTFQPSELRDNTKIPFSQALSAWAFCAARRVVCRSVCVRKKKEGEAPRTFRSQKAGISPHTLFRGTASISL